MAPAEPGGTEPGAGDSAGRLLDATVTEEAFGIAELEALVEGPDAGAVVTFQGVVRDHDGGRGVAALHYEQHPRAADALAEAARTVLAAHPEVRLAVRHRVGDLSIGDLALGAAVASAHRAAAFAACAALVDEVKRVVPIWKRQEFADGTEEWVAGLG